MSRFSPQCTYSLPDDVSSAFQQGIQMNIVLIVERAISPRETTVHCNHSDFSCRNAMLLQQLVYGNLFRQNYPEKTPGSAGGLTEFDSSGNMSLKLASAVQIGCPCHDEYLPRMHQLSETWGP